VFSLQRISTIACVVAIRVTVLLCYATVAVAGTGDATIFTVPGALQSLATRIFGTLTACERRLLTAATAAPETLVGLCGESYDENDKVNNPTQAEKWAPYRNVRADLIRWLCTDPDALKLIASTGIQVIGARIVGALNLVFAKVPFPLVFRRCWFIEGVNLSRAHLLMLDLSGSRTGDLVGIQLSIRNDLILSGLTTKGQVLLTDANIAENLDLSGARLKDEINHVALAARKVRIGHDLILSELTTTGQLMLTDANVGGNLEFASATLADKVDHFALDARHLKLGGDLTFWNVTALGTVDLSYATVEQSLFLNYGHFLQPQGVALKAQALTVSHDIFGQDITAQGKVDLQWANIGNNIDFQGSHFSNKGDTALTLEKATVGGLLDLRGNFKGEVMLGLAQVGEDVIAEQATFENTGAVAIEARQIRVTGYVWFTSSTFKGLVKFDDAQMGALTLQKARFVAGQLTTPSGLPVEAALYAVGIKVTRVLSLSGIEANGSIMLDNAEIGEHLEAVRAKINGSPLRVSYPPITFKRVSLSAVNAKVGGSVLLFGFNGNGAVLFAAAHVGKDFNTSGARLKGADIDAQALFAGAIERLCWMSTSRASCPQGPQLLGSP
jgi:hypothetical protein